MKPVNVDVCTTKTKRDENTLKSGKEIEVIGMNL